MELGRQQAGSLQVGIKQPAGRQPAGRHQAVSRHAAGRQQPGIQQVGIKQSADRQSAGKQQAGGAGSMQEAVVNLLQESLCSAGYYYEGISSICVISDERYYPLANNHCSWLLL